MSAHIITCYEPQRRAVMLFMESIGSVISSRSPQGITSPIDIGGLEHINFVYIPTHPERIPQRLWEELQRRGAIMVQVDDQYARQHARLIVSGGATNV